MDEKLFEKLTKVRPTPNVLAVDTPGYDDGKKRLIVADKTLRAYAQNIIMNINEHRHLKGAKILLLVQLTESGREKLEAGEKVVIGKASKANLKEKILSCIGGDNKMTADFVVVLNGDWLHAVHMTDDDGVSLDIATDEAKRSTIALIDHELCHCSAKIAGEFVAQNKLDDFIKELGERFIEKCSDITNEKDEVMVRYYFADKMGAVIFKMRRHDLEEFTGVVERHGAWDNSVKRFVDVIVKSEPTLFGGQQQ